MTESARWYDLLEGIRERSRELSACRNLKSEKKKPALSKEEGSNRIRDLYEWGHAKFPKLLDCRPYLCPGGVGKFRL
jgi:hypothetical protein